MTPLQRESLAVFESLRPGDVVEIRHEVKVGFQAWNTTTRGQVVAAERRRHGLHYRRNFDDMAFSDVIVLQKEDGELTTVTLDDFSILRRVVINGRGPELPPDGPGR